MKRVEMEVSAAAGLAVVFPLYQVFTLPEMCESSTLMPGEAVALLAASVSYLSVPVLSGLLGGRRGGRFVWLWTPVMGSVLCAAALYHQKTRPVDWGFGRYAMVWLALCLWTLPFAAVAYYSGVFIRGRRRRREGSEENPGISREDSL